MKHNIQLKAAIEVPNWSAPAEARQHLEEAIDNFVSAAAAATAAPDAALALRVTAGLGKTTTVLRVIARHGEALLSQGHVLVYVPTLELAERAREEFRRLAPQLPARVVRGRDAQRPDDSKNKMCGRAEFAKEIARLVPSVTRALCRGTDHDGTFVQSPCATGCPYLEQKDVPGPHVIFLSHAYLTATPPVDPDVSIALRVIDEKVWPTLIRTSHLPISDFMRAPASSFPKKLFGVMAHAKAALVDGLQRDLPVHDHVRSSGITTAQLQEIAEAEKRSQSVLEIGPWQSDEAMEFRIKTFDSAAAHRSRRRHHVFARLAEKEAGHCVGLKLLEKTDEQGSQQVIQSSWIRKIDRSAPLLLLDADADPDITEHLAPGANFVSIQSPPIADIVQVSDLTLSNSWLLDVEKGERRRAAVLEVLEREVDRSAGGGVMLVATKKVLKALHADVGNSLTGDEDAALRQKLSGADPRWFGPRTQGVNDFAGYAAIVVVGRLQPRVADIESSARAVFANDARPIIQHDSGPLPKSETQILMMDGTAQDAVMCAHPDHRVQSILTQTRECGTLQAIARLRLVSPSRAKRVVILSSLPLPDFPITRQATFAALEQDLEHERDWQGFVRMQKALRATMGRSVRGTRLSSMGLAADLPLDFVSGAARFRRGRPTAHLMSLCERVAAANGWSITSLMLRSKSGGKSVPAVVLDDGGRPFKAAKSLWPDFTPTLPPVSASGTSELIL
ncbi:DEAD/DEAH box helicase family protein [Limimaricola cinnabarinus]|uniref:DEAD/DEAH box helicase family protein n=1 Tax=Limimaricola cinnabarinus TaxID=1125964 RepID=UPI002FE1019D